MKITPSPALCAAMLLAACTPIHGLGIRTFSSSTHLRMTGFPTNPVLNPTFLNSTGDPATRLDLSGIGWSVQDPRKQLTLVSPRHFVGANHFRPAVGSTVSFLASDNTLHTLTVASVSTIPNEDASASDVFLGEFTSELSETARVLPLPYLNLTSEASYAGQSLIVAGQAARGGKGVIGNVTDFGGDPITGGTGIRTRAFSFSYSPVGSADDAHAEGGDSGSPSLAIRAGKAALVGTHTAVLSALGSTTTFDTLVPHYAGEINMRMAATGLQLRKANPSAVSLSLTGAVMDSTVRGGELFTCRFTVANLSSTEAENVLARLSVPPGFVVRQVSAAGWHAPSVGSLRRGGLAAGSTAQFDVTLKAPPVAGSFPIALAMKSDGSVSQNLELSLDLAPSYAVWAAGLADASLDGDDDGDGISNLIEYAVGGDPHVASRFSPEAGNPLLPRFSAAPRSLSFFRRTDHDLRGLVYRVQRSTDLQTGSWETIEAMASPSSAALVTGFEKVTIPLPGRASDTEFYRLQIDLVE